MEILGNKLISLITFLAIFAGISAECNFDSNKSAKIQLILSYMPWTVENGQRYLMIYWNNPFFKSGDVIKVYFEPNNTKAMNQINFFYPLTNKGSHQILINDVKFSDDTVFPTDRHLNYHAAWVRDGIIEKWTVLTTYVHWMSQRKDLLWNRTLPELFIPGSHQAGSYEDRFVSQSGPAKYVVTQGTRVLDQLIAGIRYLHLTPAYTGMSYWINHGDFQMNPLQVIVDDIKTFMNTTEEIVIIDFNAFSNGFNSNEDHGRFINYLEREFKDFYLPRKNDSSNEWRSFTLDDIWKSGNRLIISYNHPLQSTKLSLWRPCNHKWGNAPDVQTLDKYLASFEIISHNQPSNSEPKVSRAHVTLTSTSSLINNEINSGDVEHSSLYNLSIEAGREVTALYNEEFFASANVVAVNFAQATGIVPIAIEWNERRNSECSESYFNLMRSHRSYQ